MPASSASRAPRRAGVPRGASVTRKPRRVGTRPARGAMGPARRCLLDHSEVLVPEDQVGAARRRVAELGGLDVDVRPADARLEDADERLPVVARRLRDVVADSQAVGAAGNDSDGTHREVDFIKKADGVTTWLASVLVELARQ